MRLLGLLGKSPRKSPLCVAQLCVRGALCTGAVVSLALGSLGLGAPAQPAFPFGEGDEMVAIQQALVKLVTEIIDH